MDGKHMVHHNDGDCCVAASAARSPDLVREFWLEKGKTRCWGNFTPIVIKEILVPNILGRNTAALVCMVVAIDAPSCDMES